jgi:hypothetical protein
VLILSDSQIAICTTTGAWGRRARTRRWSSATGESPGGPTGRWHDGAVPARPSACRPRNERARREAGGARGAGHAQPRRQDLRSDRRRRAGPRGRRLSSARRTGRPPGGFGAGLRAGGGWAGRGREGGRRVVEVVGEPVGKRRSIIATVPAHMATSALARAPILCVRGPYYECNGRGYAFLPGVDIRCDAC